MRCPCPTKQVSNRGMPEGVKNRKHKAFAFIPKVHVPPAYEPNEYGGLNYRVGTERNGVLLQCASCEITKELYG